MKNQRIEDSEVNSNLEGSPQQGEPLYLVVGRLGKAHGLNGEILFYIITDFPDRLKAGKTVIIGENHLKLDISSIRNHGKGLIIRFKDIDTIEKVEKFRNCNVYIANDNLPKLPQGEYYHHQLLGLKVKNEQGLNIGTLIEIMETGANDVYVIESEDGQEELIPAIKNNILKVDLQEKLMVVKTLDYFTEG
jgi:16S rRNA processing protein RimM